MAAAGHRAELLGLSSDTNQVARPDTYSEHERLEALRPYQVLGTPGQVLFNGFVSVVAKLFDVPIALMVAGAAGRRGIRGQ